MRYIIFLLILVTFQLQRTSSSEFYNLLNSSDNAVLLDVRVFEEYCESRIPGAIWAGQKIVLDSLLKELDKNSTFFIYCEVGERSKEVAKILKKEKINRIIELEEGFVAWVREDFPIDTERICNNDNN